MIEKISGLQARTDERISGLQAHTDDRFLSLQAHTDDRFLSLQAHTDENFVRVHNEIAGIHKAISVQTKWLLGVMIACATMISFLHPLAMTLLAK